jgi:hypothetical protein
MTFPRVLFEQQYKVAAAEGALYELRLRRLADRVPELQQLAHAQRLEDVETLIVSHFSSVLSEDEKAALRLSRQLRNKILHCDFRAARNKLKQLGIDTPRGDVKKADVGGLSGSQMVEKIANLVASVPGAFEYVADSGAGAGSVFGWLLEVGQAGDFNQAARAFAHAAEIVDRLASG